MLAAEHGFWTDPGPLATFRPLVTAAVAACADRLVLVDSETEVAPGSPRCRSRAKARHDRLSHRLG